MLFICQRLVKDMESHASRFLLVVFSCCAAVQSSTPLELKRTAEITYISQTQGGQKMYFIMSLVVYLVINYDEDVSMMQ